MKLKIKKNDKVVVLTGKDRGKAGVVEKVFPEEMKAVVAGINTVKCLSKQARKSTKDMPIHISNLSHIEPGTKNVPVKVKVEMIKGVKSLVSKKSGKVVR
jgi:large subunit ribosomal protein L24